MSDTLQLGGHTWTRQEEKPCARCRAPTFRMWRRTPTELIWERYPGTNGAHTFTALRTGRMFNICGACFAHTFHGERQKVLAWEAHRSDRARVAEPTSE